MKFLVTGCPRSATGYMSLFFQAMRVPCSHEVAFMPPSSLIDALRWYRNENTVGESSWIAWAWARLLPGPVKAVHIVRNPWAVVDSLAFRNDLLPAASELQRSRKPLREAIAAYCPEVFEHRGDVDRAAQMLVSWTGRIEAALPEARRVCVERLDLAATLDLLDWLGIYRDECEVRSALADVPHNINGGQRIQYGLEVKNPELREAIETHMPGAPLNIARAFSKDTPRGRDELAAQMKPELLAQVDALADAWGY